jgi:hypothetical protein
MAAAVRAELLQLEAIGVVAAVLLGDVVAVLALRACQRDLWSYVGGCHGADPLSNAACLNDLTAVWLSRIARLTEE